jgi:hypothetical protein
MTILASDLAKIGNYRDCMVDLFGVLGSPTEISLSSGKFIVI